jgi:hypothetical protein
MHDCKYVIEMGRDKLLIEADTIYTRILMLLRAEQALTA